ncbi:hypothetical protein [Jeotgalibacillus haloalkalitolerans]|uniref:DUF3800 domain-containing protein n=1 Tax=Jeotgalibacillus haloalkalitolerans TaxID=3104292 RepID=A0ABU5KJL1_9BACL|nr:hypothetical protein [Jeotgalibacillus sp. HH7-29]MDZ5711370.1 hypothetical protein [Jeotgalibacillus sp. HH7-29]
MGSYELWLDESGDFEKDLEGKEVPSLVGGLLCPAGFLNEIDGNKILNEAKAKVPSIPDWVHATDIKGKKYGDFAITVLQSLINQNINLVIFENQEKLKVVNSDVTYIHILSEGIVQLFQTLAMVDKEIKLHIIAANRMKATDNYKSKIPNAEYRQRLEEKMELSFARRNLITNKWSWELSLGSARKDPRLMLADVICHSWFRRNGNKFIEEQKKQLGILYKQEYHFTAFEKATLSVIKRQLAEGQVGEALYELLIMENESRLSNGDTKKIRSSNKLNTQINSIIELIMKHLKQLPDFAQTTHLSIVTNRLKTLIHLHRDFIKAEEILNKVKELIIPELKKYKIENNLFIFNINLMLFTNATHQGNINLAEKQINENRQHLNTLMQRWESLNLVLDFLVRESVHLINVYDFKDVIIKMDQLQKFIDSTIELFPLAFKDELSLEAQKINSDIRGKVIGTRLQARCFLSREEPAQISLAQLDSDEAIKEFIDKSDLSRQYQYRSQIECEAGNYVAAISWLGSSVDIHDDHVDPLVLLNKILSSSQKVFGIMHYSRIMSEAAVNGEKDLSNSLYESWVKAEVTTQVRKGCNNNHPYEIIYWKLGTYLMINGDTKAAIERYKLAVDICFAHEEHLTMRSIGLAILAELASFLFSEERYVKEAHNIVKQLLNKYERFMKEISVPSINNFFEDWDKKLHKIRILPISEQSNILYDLSRKVGY